MTFAIASPIWVGERKTTLKGVFLAFHRYCSLFGSGLVCCAFLLIAANTPAQDTKTRTTIAGSSMSRMTYTEIPAATEPCTPEECHWWNRLREAANKLFTKGDQKSIMVYASLFVEGIEKSYRVPLADRPSYKLVFGPPVRPSANQRNGVVRLSIEYRADGSVGEVKVVNGMGPEVDRRVIQSARNSIFLPAVKDGKFVTQWQPFEIKFSTSRK